MTTINGDEIKGVVVAKPDDDYVYILPDDRSVRIAEFHYGTMDIPLSKVKKHGQKKGSMWFKDGYCCISNGGETCEALVKYPISRVRLDMGWLAGLIGYRRADEQCWLSSKFVGRTRFIEEDLLPIPYHVFLWMIL